MAASRNYSNGDARLVGTWRLLSWEREFRGSAKTEQPVGSQPNGVLMLSANGRIMDMVTASGRQAGDTDAAQAALYRTMLAYSGQYRIDGDRFITTVQVSWNEAWNGNEQERFYRLSKNRLSITSAWTPHPTLPGAPMVRNIRSWRREA